jgi:hypothetical protein
VRAHIDDPSAGDGLWKHLREWVDLANGPLVDLCLVLEETGAVLAPGPFFATTALYAPVLAASGLSGPPIGTASLPGHDYVVEADRVSAVAFVDDEGGVRVAEGPPARFVATVDTTRRLFLVDNDETARTTPLASDVVDRLLARAYVALAAELMGTVRVLFDRALTYAKERVQFDRPIGSFQAIQHKLANMALLKEQAWSAVYYAAMTIDADDPDQRRAAHVAKVMAGEAAKLNAKDAIQIHGGVGYTWEHDLHLFIRRAYASEHLLGSSDWHRDRLATLIFPR